MAAGGDGESTQFCRCHAFSAFVALNDVLISVAYDQGYVGYAPTQGTVIVAHEGTTPDNMLVQILRSFNWRLTTLMRI